MPNFATFDIRSFLGISVLLHGLILTLALWQGHAPQSLLPVGVELKYGQDPAGRLRVPVEKKSALVPQKPSPRSPPDHSLTPSSAQVNTTAPAAAEAGKLAGNPEGNSAEGAVAGIEGVRNGSEVSAEDRYLYELQKLLQRKQRYPLMAKKMRQTGTVRVRMTLQSDGSLLDSEVIEKSPYESLNVAAKNLVQEISGLKPFPQEIRKRSWVIEVPIEYILN